MTCTRRLTFSAGHRVLYHEGKCANPHGHNYVVEIVIDGGLDRCGRIVDFGLVKEQVGAWIDKNLDHVFLAWREDSEIVTRFLPEWPVCVLPVNPSAENLAQVIFSVAQSLLNADDVMVERVRIYETENCWADATHDDLKDRDIEEWVHAVSGQ